MFEDFKKLFSAYYADTSEEIATIPAWEASDLVIRVLRHWLSKAFDKKQASESTILQFEKISALCKDLDSSNQEITKTTLDLSNKEDFIGDLNPKLVKALEAKEAAKAEVIALREDLKKGEDMRLKLEGARV